MSQTQPFQFEPKYATDEEGEESLSSSQSNSEDDEKASRIEDEEDPIPDITRIEVESAIKTLKSGKAAGEDGISSTLVKKGGSLIATQLAQLFTNCLRQKKIPKSWRLTPVLDANQPREQAGFRSGFSTMDNIHTVNQVIEKYHEHNLPLCLAFIDYKKAFDSVVQEYERAVIFRLGRLLSGGPKGPGTFLVLPFIENYTKVDLRTLTFDVPPQEILTKDSVTVSVDAVVYYRVFNATVSVANVENAHHSTRLLAQTTLRNILGTKNLAELLSDRDTISSSIQNTLDGATDAWGIKVERVEMKDVRLPVQLQRAMAAEAEAAREARAKLIAAEGEYKSSRALKEAADVLSQSKTALQLRFLQTLNTISAEKNSTIVFPLPMDFLHNFINN
ncbi:Stomatin-2 [Nymphon striatum]|nr:Stomatin-2 [Nymphon striatum]